jgi:hypothetical protein
MKLFNLRTLLPLSVALLTGLCTSALAANHGSHGHHSHPKASHKQHHPVHHVHHHHPQHHVHVHRRVRRPGWIVGTVPGVVVVEGETPVVSGVEITRLLQGTAARQGLQVGDIILNAGGIPTPTVAILADAVREAGSQVEVAYVNGRTGVEQSVLLYPQAGKIGVAGVSVPVE